jgi:hypothetical protein
MRSMVEEGCCEYMYAVKRPPTTPLEQTELHLPPFSYGHGLINYTHTKAKMSPLKKFTCKGTLRQVFIRFNTPEIQSVVLVFSTQLC